MTEKQLRKAALALCKLRGVDPLAVRPDRTWRNHRHTEYTCACRDVEEAQARKEADLIVSRY